MRNTAYIFQVNFQPMSVVPLKLLLAAFLPRQAQTSQGHPRPTQTSPETSSDHPGAAQTSPYQPKIQDFKFSRFQHLKISRSQDSRPNLVCSQKYVLLYKVKIPLENSKCLDSEVRISKIQMSKCQV